MQRRIPIEQLKPGMYLAGLDLSWLKSPFWIHRGSVKSHAVIFKLKQSGVREVTIDPEQGLDVEESSSEMNVCADLEKGASFQVTDMAELPRENRGEWELDEAGPVLEKTFDLAAFEEELRLAQEVRSKAISAIKQVFEGIKTGVVLDVGPLRDVTETLLDCLKAREGNMLVDAQLQRMIQFDASLFSHAVDVCVLALAEIKALPDDIRRYAGNGRYKKWRALGLSLHRVEQGRRDKAVEAAQPVLPKLDNRKRLFIQKYVELGAKWGAGERAAIMAGYGKISAYQGGRSAAVKASVLLKRADIQKAIREYRDMLYQDEQVRLAAEKRADARAMINTIIDNLKMYVSDSQPQSRAAQVLRRLQGQPVRRVPGYCVCGDPVTEGYASCEPCRIKHRHYRQAERAAKRERRTCHYGR